MNRRLIDVPGGVLACVDYGGSGRDLLLLHGPGLNSAVWTTLGWELSARTHTLALDLPGHGKSTVDYVDHDHAVNAVASAIRTLGLDRPLIVAQDGATFIALVLAHLHPDLVGGVVSLDTSYAVTREGAAETVAFTDSDEFLEQLRDRYALGKSFTSEAECYLFIDAHTAELESDWVVDAAGDSLDDSFLHAVRHEGDLWRIHPLPEVVRRAYRHDTADHYYPSADIYDGLTVPVCIMHATAGFDMGRTTDVLALAARHPNVKVDQIEGEHFFLHKDPVAVTRRIWRFADEVDGNLWPQRGVSPTPA